MENSSTDRVTSWKTWGTVIVALVSSVIFVLGVTLGYSPFAAFRPTATPSEYSAERKCMDIGISGNAEWDRFSSSDYELASRTTSDLGIGRVRIGAIWSDIEKTQGVYDWSALDMRVRHVRDAGLAPLLILQGSPSWLPIPAGPITPEHLRVAQKYGVFAGEVAGRYGGDVDSYEIWNEPNLARFWEHPDAALYTEFLKAAYPAIHAADARATVITAGLAPATNSHGSIAPVTFLNRLYDHDGGRYSDAIGMHPYTFPEMPSGQSTWNTFRALNEVKQLMAARGDAGKEIWLTEYGAPTGGVGWVSPDTQAEMVAEAIVLARSDLSLGPIFVYTLVDGGAQNWDPEDHFGLYYTDLSPKPAVRAIHDLVKECA